MNTPDHVSPVGKSDGQTATPTDQVEQTLYAKRQKIYPREVHGLFARLRVTGILTLLGIYYLVPWLRWDERQAVLFDLPNRKFYIFDLILWPQDFLFLAWLLVIAALALFFFTAIAGRLWCGYACPQTVWTEVFLWMERLIEGDRPRQMKLDREPWGPRKLAIKISKHAVWITFSLFTGFTFLGYFTPILGITGKIATLSLGPWETFWILFYSFATYGNAGWLREQVCIYMCPYARFQGAMFDSDTLIISYDALRGEARGSRRRGEDFQAKGLGHCIDCTLCVQVCPTGIDIRDGLQYECIACAACIDVCDEIMGKMDYPPGLIRYTTSSSLEGKPTRVLRPRTWVYATLLLLLSGGLIVAVAKRATIDVDVIRDRNALYRETDEGQIENVYTLKIINKDSAGHRFRLEAEGIDDLKLIGRTRDIDVAGGEVLSLPVRVQVDPASLRSASTTLRFILSSEDSATMRTEEEARFLGTVIR